MRIVYISPEVYPYAQTSGLAHFSHSLPKHLYEMGHDIRVFMPRYRCVQDKEKCFTPAIHNLQVDVGDEEFHCNVVQSCVEALYPIYFIEQDEFFDRRELYQSDVSVYPDNAIRFIFFCRSVIESLKKIDFRPDIIHVNDWQSALVPVFLKTLYGDDPFFAQTKSILTIHHLEEQGIFWHFDMHLLGLPWNYFTPDYLEYYGKLSFLKGGIVFSDYISFLSESYAAEVQLPKSGYGFDGILKHRRDRIIGIPPGVDRDLWNSAEGENSEGEGGAISVEGKKLMRKKLMNMFGLENISSNPLCCFIGKLSSENGLDLLIDSIEEIMSGGFSLIIQGKGDLAYRKSISRFVEGYPDKIHFIEGFDIEQTKLVLSASDIFLMPMKHQTGDYYYLTALNYHNVLCAHATGGISDIVQKYHPAEKSGRAFLFSEWTREKFLEALNNAKKAFGTRKTWQKLIRENASKDISWQRSASQYVELYQKTQKVSHVKIQETRSANTY